MKLSTILAPGLAFGFGAQAWQLTLYNKNDKKLMMDGTGESPGCQNLNEGKVANLTETAYVKWMPAQKVAFWAADPIGVNLHHERECKGEMFSIMDDDNRGPTDVVEPPQVFRSYFLIYPDEVQNSKS